MADIDDQVIAAIRDGETAELERLFRDEAAFPRRIVKGGQTLLHYAASINNLPAMNVLKKYGADPHAPDESGSTPLLTAAEGGHIDAVKFMMAWGAQPQARNKDGETALHIAARHGYAALATLIAIEAPYIVSFLMKGGKTAAMTAAEHDNPDTLDALRRAGADLLARDESDQTAMDWAIKGNAKMAQEYLSLWHVPTQYGLQADVEAPARAQFRRKTLMTGALP